MTVIAEGRERAGIGRADRIGTLVIVTGAVRRLRAGGWRTLALLIATSAFGWALQTLAKAVGVNLTAPAVTPAYLAYLSLAAAGAGVGAALALRLFVRGPDRWLAMDRPLFAGSLAMGAITLSSGLVAMISAATRGSGPAAGLGSVAVSIGYLAVFYAALRLTLWPVSLVMGRNLSLKAAWRLMRKATRGTILGYVIFGLPFILVMAASWTELMAGRQPEGLRQGLFVLVGAAYGLA